MSSEIFFSPVTSVLSNRPPGTVVCGVPGSGKTFCLQNIACNCMEQGITVFALDAKNDMMKLKNVFPDIRIINVNDVKPGSLDPFLVFDDVDATIIMTITKEMCGKLTDEQRSTITPLVDDFVKKVKKKQRVSFRDFADKLYANQNPIVQQVGSALLINANTKYGALIFGTPGVRPKPIRMDKVNQIISIFGMELPSGTTEPQPDQLVTSAVVYIICRLMKNILVKTSKLSSGSGLFKGKNSKESKRPTVLFLDECHILMKSQAIKNIIEEILILGRSLNVAICLASQNVTHFDDKLSQLVSTKIAFRMSRKESEEFFSRFNNTSDADALNVSDCIEKNTRLKTGYCFFIDSKERCTLMHVESNYSSDLTTNPLFQKNEFDED